MLALEMKPQIILEQGVSLISFIGLLVLTTLLLSPILGKLLKLPKETSWLTGIGMAICGSSAIVACLPFISKEKKQAAYALGAINILGTIALAGLPFILGSINSDMKTTSFSLGALLPSVGHVVALGSLFDEQTTHFALSFKMIRVFYLIPLVFILSLTQHKNSSLIGIFKSLPGYVYGFALFLVLGSFIKPEFLPPKILSTLVLNAFMFAIGARIHLKELLKNLTGSLILSVALFLWISFFCFGYHYFWAISS
jgi:uncharacterized integral membrane protein (TIGR00698 family)